MVGIVAAIKEELESIKEYMSNIREENEFGNIFYIGKIGNSECVLTLCGVGKVNAARSTQMLIGKYNPDYIINVGVAGGISNRIKIGDIVIAEKLVQYDFDTTAFGDKLGELPGGIGVFLNCDSKLVKKAENVINRLSNLHSIIGTVATGDRFVTETDRSKEINSIFDADCVEMEGASIAQVCYLDKIPFIVIRSISDSINDNNKIDFETFAKSSAENAATFVNEFLK